MKVLLMAYKSRRSLRFGGNYRFIQVSTFVVWLVFMVSLCCNLCSSVVNCFFQSGNLVLKDFDIKKAQGGYSFQVVTREVTAVVSNNVLEVHLLWARKGTCCVPDKGTYGPLISAISATPSTYSFTKLFFYKKIGETIFLEKMY